MGRGGAQPRARPARQPCLGLRWKKDEKEEEHSTAATGQMKDEELNQNIEIKNGGKDTGLKTV